MSKDALIIRLQVLKVSFYYLKASNIRSEKPMGVHLTPLSLGVGRSRVKHGKGFPFQKLDPKRLYMEGFIIGIFTDFYVLCSKLL